MNSVQIWFHARWRESQCREFGFERPERSAARASRLWLRLQNSYGRHAHATCAKPSFGFLASFGFREFRTSILSEHSDWDFAFPPRPLLKSLQMGSEFHPLNPRSDPALLSLVIPVYNEAAVLGMLRRELTAFTDDLPMAWELIFVNDGSCDDSLKQLLEWSSKDSRIKIMGLARNFGHQAAVTAGLDAARGDAVVVMDADLQDPPVVILEMLREYRSGFDVVYGQRVTRHGETFFKRASAWVFYRLMQRFVHESLPIDAGDFRLISRPCLDAVRSMRETHRFLRGMVAWVGFPQTAVPYERPGPGGGRYEIPDRANAAFCVDGGAVLFTRAAANQLCLRRDGGIAGDGDWCLCGLSKSHGLVCGARLDFADDRDLPGGRWHFAEHWCAGRVHRPHL